MTEQTFGTSSAASASCPAPSPSTETSSHHRLVSKEQAESWRYARRELEDALVVGDCSGMYDVVRARRRAVMIGLVLALLIAGGACLWAKMKPKPTLGDAVVVRTSDTDELLVLLHGTWHPAVDLASARIALGEPASVKSLPSSVLDGMPRGHTVGILGPVGIPAEPEQWSGSSSVFDGSAGSTGDSGAGAGIGIGGGAGTNNGETGIRLVSGRSPLSHWWLCHDIDSNTLVVVPSEAISQALQRFPSFSGAIGGGLLQSTVDSGSSAGAGAAGGGGVGVGITNADASELARRTSIHAGRNENTGNRDGTANAVGNGQVRTGESWVVRSESGTWLVGFGLPATPPVNATASEGTPTQGESSASHSLLLKSPSSRLWNEGSGIGIRRLQLAAPGETIPTGIARALGLEKVTLPILPDVVLSMIPSDGTLDDLVNSIFGEGGTSIIGVPIGSVVTPKTTGDQSQLNGELIGNSDYYLALAQGVTPLSVVHARILVAMRPGNLQAVNTAELLTAPREIGPRWSVVPGVVPQWPTVAQGSDISASASSQWMGCGRVAQSAVTKSSGERKTRSAKGDRRGQWLWIQGSGLITHAVDTGIRSKVRNNTHEDADTDHGITADTGLDSFGASDPNNADHETEQGDDLPEDMTNGFPVKYWGDRRARAGSINGEFVVVGADGRIFDVPTSDVVKALGLGTVNPIDATLMDVLPYAGELSEKRVMAGPFAAQV